MNRTLHRLETIAANLAPPFADPDAIDAMIALADELLGDTDLEDHPTLGEHDGIEPDEDGEYWLGWANPGEKTQAPDGWSPADVGEWTLNCDMLQFDGSGYNAAERMLQGICSID